MATTADDITVAEFADLEEFLFERLREGEDLFHIELLVRHTNLTDAKIYEGMGLLCRKNDRVSNVGAGVWQIELPEE